MVNEDSEDLAVNQWPAKKRMGSSYAEAFRGGLEENERRRAQLAPLLPTKYPQTGAQIVVAPEMPRWLHLLPSPSSASSAEEMKAAFEGNSRRADVEERSWTSCLEGLKPRDCWEASR